MRLESVVLVWTTPRSFVRDMNLWVI